MVNESAQLADTAHTPPTTPIPHTPLIKAEDGIMKEVSGPTPPTSPTEDSVKKEKTMKVDRASERVEQNRALFGMGARRLVGSAVLCELQRRTEDWVVQELDENGEPVGVFPKREPVNESERQPSCVRDAWVDACDRVYAGISEQEEIDIQDIQWSNRQLLHRRELNKFIRIRYSNVLFLADGRDWRFMEIRRSRADTAKMDPDVLPFFFDEPTFTNVHFTLRKRNAAMTDVETALKQLSGRVEVEFSSHMQTRGVTVQRIVVNNFPEDKVSSLQKLGAGISVFNVQCSESALSTPESAGRRFTVVIRDVQEYDKYQLSCLLEEWMSRGFPNYFCPEQFEHGAYSAVLGAAMLRGEWRKAAEGLLRRWKGTGSLQSVIDGWKKTGVVSIADMDDEDWDTVQGMALDCIDDDASESAFAELFEQPTRDACIDAYLWTLWNRLAAARIRDDEHPPFDMHIPVLRSDYERNAETEYAIDLYSRELANDGIGWDDVKKLQKAGRKLKGSVVNRALFVCPKNVDWNMEWERKEEGRGKRDRNGYEIEGKTKKTAIVTLWFDLPVTSYGSVALREVVTTGRKDKRDKSIEEGYGNSSSSKNPVKSKKEDEEPYKKVPKLGIE